MWPAAYDSPRLEPAAAADFESLLALRIRAMGPSLEALGRCSRERARAYLRQVPLFDEVQRAGTRQLVHGGPHMHGWASGETLTTGDAFIAADAGSVRFPDLVVRP
jgi:hypothetical protein